MSPLLFRERERKEKLEGPVVPPRLEEKLRRGREAMKKDAPMRRLCDHFERGEQYWYLNQRNQLLFQDTVTFAGGGGKPRHRIRNKYNFIGSIVEAKISAATQRVPGYEITPATNEPEDATAAALSEQVAIYGYDKWFVRRATAETVKRALVAGEGFVYPYFDTTIGPFINTGELDDKGKPRLVGRGEIRLLRLSANEVFWEAGCSFEESRWHAIERACTPDEIRATPGYYGGDPTPDATTGDIPKDRDQAEMVLKTEVFERPSPMAPDGRKITIANGRVICPPADFPCRNHKGEVVDEPCLHRLSYFVDPERDRDRGLVEQLIDLQRTINDCWAKILEWKNRCLNPQLLAPTGSIKNHPGDVPGAIIYYDNFIAPPTWEKPPAIPRELFEVLEQAITHMRAIAADIDIQPEADLAARTANLAAVRGDQRWQSFIGDLAEFHSRLMRHCLWLVQAHYTEPRQLEIMGDYGPDPIDGFVGQDLRGQANVRVNPGSIEAKSRQRVFEETMVFAREGWISPQAAMAQINGGVGDKLANSFLRDVQRANHVIQAIKRGDDPATGENAALSMRHNPDGTPGWMPRSFDNPDVHLAVFEDWMKTPEWDRLDDVARAIASMIYRGLQEKIAERQAREIEAQNAMAESKGMQNAAKEPAPKPMPDEAAPVAPA